MINNIGFICHPFRGTVTNFPLKIASKPLQIKTRLLFTAYRKSRAPYPMLPSPTPYDFYRLATIYPWQPDGRHPCQ